MNADRLKNSALLDRLKKLLPMQFQEVVYKFGMPDAYLSQNTSQTERAIALLRYAEQQVDGVAYLEEVLGGVEPESGRNLQSYAVPTDSQTRENALNPQLDQLAHILNEKTTKELEEIFARYQQGQALSALQSLEAIKANHTYWASLSNKTKAQTLRTEALIRLHQPNGVTLATQLADEADRHAPSEGPSPLRALITWAAHGPEQALPLVDAAVKTEAKVMKASLLAALERFQEMETLLEEISGDTTIEAEKLRLRSMAKLYGGELTAALNCIEQAAEQLPTARLIRETRGALLFYSALSPMVVPKLIPGFPDPVSRIVINQDAQSLARLDEAAGMFQALLDACDRDWDLEQRHAWQGWRLACLACHQDRRDEAQSYCQSLLDEHAAHIQALAWGLARGFLAERYLTHSTTALEKLLDTEPPGISRILILCGLYLQQQQADAAQTLLRKFRSAFEQPQHVSLWRFWLEQVYQGEVPAELEIDAQTGDARDGKIRLLQLEKAAVANEDFNALYAHAEQALQGQWPLEIFVEACDFLARRGAWEFIAKHAHELVAKTRTPVVVEMALQACFNTYRYQDVLTLLETWESIFPNGKFPRRIREIKPSVQAALGKLNEAIDDGEKLARETGELQDWLGTARLHFSHGNPARAAESIQIAKSKYSLTPEQNLDVAQQLSLESQYQELARQSWREAVQTKLPNDLLVNALDLAFKLDMEAEAAPLFQLFHQETAAGNVPGAQLISLDDMRAFGQEQQQRAATRKKLYDSGQISIHMAAEDANQTLIYFYRQNLLRAEQTQDLTQAPALLARHGGRPVQEIINTFPESRTQWNLHLDMTALLLAAHLEILDKVEQCFERLTIPAPWAYALQKMLDQVTPGQPGRLEAKRQVMRLVENKRLTVIQEPESLEGFAQQAGYTVLDWTRPLENSEPLSPASRINCRYVAEELLRLGGISKSVFEQAVHRLGREGDKAVGEVRLTKGQGIVCRCDGTAISLVKAELFKPLIDTFDVCLFQETVDQLQAELDYAKQAEELAEWIVTLRERINRGLTTESYQVLPLAEHDEEIQQALLEGEFDTACLLTLLSLSPESEKAHVWCDDRFASGYPTVNNIHPILTIHDILNALVKYDALEKPEYYKLLLRLRDSNVRFIPLEEAEIFYHLQNASVENGRVNETPELATLRRYFAACFCEDTLFYTPNEEEQIASHPRGELDFFVYYNYVVSKAILKVWNYDALTTTDRFAWSEWIFSNLFAEYYFTAPGLRKAPEAAGIFFTHRYAALLTGAFNLATLPYDEVSNPLIEYIDWLYENHLKIRIESNPTLIYELVNDIEQFISEILHGEEFKKVSGFDDAEVFNWKTKTLGRVIRALPNPIRNQLGKSFVVRRELELATEPLIPIAEYYFEHKLLIQSMTQAIKKRRSKLAAWNRRKSFLITHDTKKQDKHPTFFFNAENPEDSFRFVGIENTMLLLSVNERLDALRQHAHFFDIPKQRQDAVFYPIARNQNAVARFDAVHDLLLNSCPYFYEQLYEAIERQHQFQIQDLIPHSAEALLRFLRLEDKPDFVVGIEQAARRLIHDLGITEAVLRLSSLPCSLPAPIHEHLAKLAGAEKQKVFTAWRNGVGSPLSLFHFIYGAVRYEAWEQNDLSQMLEAFLIHPERDAILKTFLAILHWLQRYFASWQAMQPWHAVTRLSMVWLHADRLMSVLMRIGWPGEQFHQMLQKIIQNQHFSLPIACELEESRVGRDVANPFLLPSQFFILQGLGYALEDDSLLTEKSRTEIHQLAVEEQETQELPAFVLLRASELATNKLGTFFQQNLGEVLARWHEMPLADWYHTETLKKFVDLENQQEAPLPHVWGYILTVLPYHRSFPDRQPAFMQWLADADLAALWDTEPEIAGAATTYLAETARYSGDPVFKAEIRAKLMASAKFIYTHKIKTKHNPPEMDLLEACLVLALSAETLSAYAQQLGELIEEICGVHPGLTRYAQHFLQSNCENLPLAEASLLWPLIFKLRAR